MTRLDVPPSGCVLLEDRAIHDSRGYFRRLGYAVHLEERGLQCAFRQTALSFNAIGGTLRGLHFQRPPEMDAKLVHCLSGSIFDVVIDLRPSSQHYGRWFGVELSAENCRGLFIPAGCAHGFQTLADNTNVLYQISTDYLADAAGGVLWSDPDLDIDWPAQPSIISKRDRDLPLLRELDPRSLVPNAATGGAR